MFIDINYGIDSTKSYIENHIATISWYIVFIFIIPFTIRYLAGFNALKYYFPVVDLIANTFTSSGLRDRLFKDLYKLSPNNIISYLSTNFINLLALLGVSWNGISYYIKYKEIWIGVAVTLIMYTVTYLLPTQLIPFVIRYFHETIEKKIEWKYDFYFFDKKIHLEDYLVGFTIIIGLIIIEGILVATYIKTLE